MPTPADRPAILAALTALFVTLALALPVARIWLATRTFPIVAHRTADPVARATQLGVGAQLAGVIAWAVAFSQLGPGPLSVWPVPRWAWLVGASLLALGLLAVVAAQWEMGTSWRVGIDDRPTELVSTGLFRAIRNPIYTGVLLMLAGLCAATPSPWTLGFLVNTALFLAVEARLEEAHLHRLHGAAYRAYACRVGRFLPGIGKLPLET